jgi:hypothetical protein
MPSTIFSLQEIGLASEMAAVPVEAFFFKAYTRHDQPPSSLLWEYSNRSEYREAI